MSPCMLQGISLIVINAVQAAEASAFSRKGDGIWKLETHSFGELALELHSRYNYNYTHISAVLIGEACKILETTSVHLTYAYR